jgi:signal peptidase I
MNLAKVPKEAPSSGEEMFTSWQAANISDDGIGGQNVKDPWLAALLSTMLPGAGHIYAGRKWRGLTFIALMLVCFLVVILAFGCFLLADDKIISRKLLVTALTGILVIAIVAVCSLFDAYRIANRYSPGHIHACNHGSKSWFAAFLSYALPGLGQLYNRQIIKGLALLIAGMAVSVCEPEPFRLSVLGSLLRLIGLRDAFDSAQKLNGRGDRFLDQKPALLIFIGIMLTLQVIPLQGMVKAHIGEAIRIQSDSMYPALKHGDHILVLKTKPFWRSIKRGDVVVFHDPANPTNTFVRRVIGVGGDKIQINAGNLYVNDRLIRETPENASEAYDQPWLGVRRSAIYERWIDGAPDRVPYAYRSETNKGLWGVPEDGIFVAGDTRDGSQDSRSFGLMARNMVAGKAVKIYWSWDRSGSNVRWDRIGEAIR